MSKIRDYEEFMEEAQPIRIKIVRRTKIKSNNDKDPFFNKRKKRRRQRNTG